MLLLLSFLSLNSCDLVNSSSPSSDSSSEEQTSIDSKDKEEAEDLISDLKKALEDGDIEEIKKEKEKLQEKAMAMSAKVYEEEAKKRQAEQEESEDDEDEKPAKKDKKKKKKDDVEEADIEEE